MRRWIASRVVKQSIDSEEKHISYRINYRTFGTYRGILFICHFYKILVGIVYYNQLRCDPTIISGTVGESFNILQIRRRQRLIKRSFASNWETATLYNDSGSNNLRIIKNSEESVRVWEQIEIRLKKQRDVMVKRGFRRNERAKEVYNERTKEETRKRMKR